MNNSILLTITASIFMTFNAFATHLNGGSITYRYIDTLQYEVTVIYYRDCRGIPLNAGQLTVSCDGANVSNVTITRRSVKDITQVCSSVSLPCSPSDTRSGKGVEEHTYIDTLDFNTIPLNKIKNCGGKIRFTTELNARNTSINTGPIGTFFTYAELDLKNTPTNSSPSFENKPLLTQCANQPVYYNHSATDKKDKDSLSHEWSPPLRGWAQQLTYSGRNYSHNHPFDVYYPGAIRPPYVNPGANPPIGLYLDPETGDIIYTPTRIGEVTVAVIKVREWRKDTAGVMRNISSIQRDIQVVTEACPDNNPPEVKGPYSYEVCEGDSLCFNVQSDDKRFIPPPPASSPLPDTVTLTWNEGIENATFKIINPTARLQTGRFCWTTDSGTAKADPYTFTVTARDDACPINGLNTRAFRVQVKPRAKTDINIVDKKCGWFEVVSDTNSTFLETPSYHWILLDSNQNIILESAVALFKSTGNFLSREKSDSIKFNRPGTYIIQHDINNNLVNCPSTYFDTVVISPKPYPNIIFADTAICPGTGFTITAHIAQQYDALTYQWYRGQDTLIGEDSSSLSLLGFDSDSAVFYRLEVIDTSTCTSSDGISIVNLDISESNIQKEYMRCLKDTLVLQLDSSNTDILWSPSLDTTWSIRVSESTPLDVTFIDSLGCEQSVKSNVIFNELPKPQLKDSGYCVNSAVLDPGEFERYVWSDSSTTRLFVASKSDLYSVEVEDTNGCRAMSTAQIILHNPDPMDLGKDTAFCGDSMVYQLPANNAYIWSTGESSSSVTVYRSGEYWAILTDSNGCEASDTVKLELNSNQRIPLLTKIGDSLFSNQSGRHKWFRDGKVISGQFGTAIRLSSVGDYTAIYLDDNNCVSDTSLVFSYTANLPIIKSLGFKVYPNPSDGNFKIELLSNIEDPKLFLVDALRAAIPLEFIQKENVLYMETNLAPGVYTLLLKTKKGQHYSKVLLIE